MNIFDLLSPSPQPQNQPSNAPIHDDDLMSVWEQLLHQSGFRLKATCERNTLTDAILSPMDTNQHEPSPFIKDTPIHIKVIGRHMNGSFRCHIGTGKASRPIRSQELGQQMRLLAVFFRAENSKSQLVSPDFIFFPTWLFHLFRYTQYDTSPGRTDVRFLENASLAKDDHIYRLNHVLNSLFRFSLRDFNLQKVWDSVALANFLFDDIGLDCLNSVPSSPSDLHLPPCLYPTLITHLQASRPTKSKPMCSNCNTKPASRRKLCVACYRYHLKHGEPRPLRLIVANRPGPRQHYQPQPTDEPSTTTIRSLSSTSTKKHCANCGVLETHQWYRNLCGEGHWCETCKSYYLRHNKVRPSELFVKAAKRKVNVRSLVNWATRACNQHQQQHQQPLRRLSTCSSASNETTFPTATITPTSPSTELSSPASSPSSSSSSWTPSGCRPHLYHPRNNNITNSECNSPNSISAPNTPPSSLLTSHDYPSVNHQQQKHSIPLSLPSLQRSFPTSQDYDPAILHCI